MIIGKPIEQATVVVNGENIGKTPSASIRVSDASWEQVEIRVIAEGYITRTIDAVREVKTGPIIAGMLLGLWPLVWVYGPKATQTVTLTAKETPGE